MILSEDHRAVQDAVRAYVQDQIAPRAAAWDKSHHFPAAELRGLAALGCCGVAVPDEWDGAARPRNSAAGKWWLLSHAAARGAIWSCT